MKKLSNVLVLVAVMALMAGPAIGADLAKPSFGAARVQWDAQGPYERLILTVSTPGGKVVRQEVGAGETPEFDLSSAEGATDGAYTWELRLIPRFDAGVRNALAEARRKGDDAAIERMRAEGKIPAEHVQSGSFVVEAGTIVGSGEVEPKPVKSAKDAAKNVTAADQVIPDDLIVQGSACVGLDCVNNENFGFDTIRMKENNLRIHFDDTSTQVGFPANDWRLIANDSASGGSSKFSIEDSTSSKTPFTITAGAATNSIFVDSTGRLGLRTSTPVLDLHINTSNTPSIRLEQNNSGGFTAQTWDIGANEANFFVRDVTGGSKLSFRIRPGAPTSSVDISADGDVGIGTASPDTKLHIDDNTDANVIATLSNTSAGLTANAVWRAQADAAQTNLIAHSSTRTVSRFGETLGGATELFSTGGTKLLIGTLEADNLIFGTNNLNRMSINGSTGAVIVAGNLTVNGTFSNPSSRSLKEAFAPVDPSTVLEKFALLPINEWSYKSDDRKLRHVGPTVEDFQNAFGLGTEGKYIFPMDVQGVTMAAVQGIYRLVQEKDAQIAELQKQVQEIKQLLEKANQQ